MKKIILLCLLALPSVVYAASGTLTPQRYHSDSVAIVADGDKVTKDVAKALEKQFGVKLKLSKSKVKGKMNRYTTSRIITTEEQASWEQVAETAGGKVYFQVPETELKNMAKTMKTSLKREMKEK